MPDQLTPQELEIFNFEQEPYRFETQDFSAEAAVTIVKQEFDKYSNWRHSSKDTKWTDNDALYYGNVPRKNWEGTNVPRSSLGVPVTFDQIESAFPLIINELFNNQPRWFDVAPTPFTNVGQANQLADAIAYQLNLPLDISGITPTLQFHFAVREMLRYGTGVMEIGIDGESNNIFLKWVPIKDFYFDPSINSPIIDHAASVIRRKQISIEELEALRDKEGITLPSPAVLNFLSKQNLSEQADSTKEFLATLRGEMTYEVINGQPINPSQQKIELLERWSDEKLIWLLGRRVTIFNGPNPYGFKPFSMAPCFYDTGFAYGRGYGDVLGDDQRLQQGLVNGRIDEISLALHPPRTRVRRTGLKKSLAWKPGLIDEVEDPAKAVAIHYPINITQNAAQEIAMSEARVVKRTGINQATQTGTPTPSNANRTARGASQPFQVSATRLRPIVENVENFMIVPLLYKMQFILNKFTPPDQQGVPASNGIVPRNILGTPVTFQMLGSTKMVSREKLGQIILPITNTLFTDAVISALQGQGQTINFAEWSRMFSDATDTKEKYQLFRPMTEEEIEDAKEPSPEVQMQLQTKQAELETRQSMGQMKAKSDVDVARIKAQTDADETGEKSARELLSNMSKQQIEQLKLLAAKEKAKNAGQSNSK